MTQRRLRIFVCLIFDTGPSLWHRQFPDTLRDMGHDVVLAEEVGLTAAWTLASHGEWDASARRGITAGILERFRMAHREKPVDLFFAYLYPFQFDARLFDEVKSEGVPVASFFCDNLSHPEVAARLAPHATLNWVPERAAMPQFERAGARAVYLPMAANPKHNYPVEAEETLPVSFAGGSNPFRRELLGEAITLGLPLTIYGGGWLPDSTSHHVMNAGSVNVKLPKLRPLRKVRCWAAFKLSAAQRFLKHGLAPRRAARDYARMGSAYDQVIRQHGSVDALDLIQLNALYARSAVSLGINDQFCSTAKPPLYSYAKMREFEATMAGACYLTQATSESADLFEIGTEIECYASSAELVAKASELLAAPERRRAMREAARKRALGEHTWQHRFTALFDRLGI